MGMLDEKSGGGTEEKVSGFARWLRFVAWLSVAGVAVMFLLALTTKGGGLYYLTAAITNALLIPLLFGRAAEADLVVAIHERLGAIEAMQAIQKIERQPLTFTAPASDGRAPLTSGPRKLVEEEPRAKIEAPKIDLSSIKESDR